MQSLSAQELDKERLAVLHAFRDAMPLGTEPRLNKEGTLIFGATNTPEQLLIKISCPKERPVDPQTLMAKYRGEEPLADPFSLRPSTLPAVDRSPLLTTSDIEILERAGFHDKLLALDDALIKTAETEAQIKASERFGAFRETYEAMMRNGSPPTVYLEDRESIPLTRDLLLKAIEEAAAAIPDNKKASRVASTAKNILTTVLKIEQSQSEGFKKY